MEYPLSLQEAHAVDEVFAEKAIKRIADCNLCVNNPDFNPQSSEMKEMRMINCKSANDYGPSTKAVETIYLAEAPPHMNRYIYRLNTPLATQPHSLPYIIQEDLKKEGVLDPNWNAGLAPGSTDEKKEFLRLLKSEGILILDCCHCVTGLDKPGLRMKYVRKCFDRCASRFLVDIVKGRDVEVVCCYASPKKLLRRQKSGFKKTCDRNGLTVWKYSSLASSTKGHERQ